MSETVNMIDKVIAGLSDRNRARKQSAVGMLKRLTCFPKGSGAEDAEKIVQNMLDRDSKGLVFEQLTQWAAQDDDERLKFCATMALTLKQQRRQQRAERERRQRVIVMYVTNNGRIRYAR